MRTVLAMEIAESSRGRRERSPKQEYLKQVCLWCEDERRGRFI